jgi:hypothetical protein
MGVEMLTEQEKQANAVLRSHIQNSQENPEGLTKVARATSDYIRMKLREEGFLRKILPAQTITGDDLDKQVGTDKPSKVVELEPDSPAAVSIPFGEFPEGTYIHGRRWLVTFSRVATRMFNKDVAELHDYDLDLRQVISDNALRDLQAEEDGKFIQVCNSLLSNDAMAAGQTVTATSKVQWSEATGGLNRDNLIAAKRVMMDLPAKLRPQMCLANQKTVLEFEKWGMDLFGGPGSEEVLRRGWAAEENVWGALNWVTTIKDDLVPDGTLFMFASPEYLGRLYFLEDTTMFVERKGPMISWYSYEMLGGGIANIAAVTRFDITDI